MSFRAALSAEEDEAEIMNRNGRDSPADDRRSNWTGMKVHVSIFVNGTRFLRKC